MNEQLRRVDRYLAVEPVLAGPPSRSRRSINLLSPSMVRRSSTAAAISRRLGNVDGKRTHHKRTGRFVVSIKLGLGHMKSVVLMERSLRRTRIQRRFL